MSQLNIQTVDFAISFPAPLPNVSYLLVVLTVSRIQKTSRPPPTSSTTLSDVSAQKLSQIHPLIEPQTNQAQFLRSSRVRTRNLLTIAIGVILTQRSGKSFTKFPPQCINVAQYQCACCQMDDRKQPANKHHHRPRAHRLTFSWASQHHPPIPFHHIAGHQDVIRQV